MKTTWQNISLKSYPSFNGEAECEVAIVGGGIAGISAAYMLAKAGKSVIVVEKEELMESTTAYTTAFLTSSVDTDIPDLKKMYGLAATKKIIESHEEAIDTIEKIVASEKIDCEFSRVPSYSVAFEKDTLDSFSEEQSIRSEAGYKAKIVSSDTLPFKNCGCLELKDQAKFHPLKYLSELRSRAEALGVQFFEHSEALSVEGDTDVTVTLAKGKIKTKSVVIATYKPFQAPIGFVWKKGMYTSYVMELEIPKGVLPEMLMEDDANPYHYVRADAASADHDRVIVGGQDHREEIPLNPNRGFNALKDFVENDLNIKTYKIITKWTGGILESSDGLAFIGLQSKKYNNRYVASAFSGNGMTYGTLSALIITDLITGTPNKWQKVYDPRRTVSLKSLLYKGRDYISELIHGLSDNFSHSKNNLTSRKIS